jgi:hypothetical protein
LSRPRQHQEAPEHQTHLPAGPHRLTVTVAFRTEGISYTRFKLSEIHQQRHHPGVTREVAGSIALQTVAPTGERLCGMTPLLDRFVYNHTSHWLENSGFIHGNMEPDV